MNNQEQATSQTGAKGARQDQDDAKRGESSGGKIQEVAEQARKAATEQVDSMRESVDSAKARAAERVRKIGQAVRKIGEHMRVEDQQYIADQANSASQRIETVASYLEEAELGTLFRDSEAIARKRPTIVLGGAFLLGLAAGRFLKTPASSGAGVMALEPRNELPEPEETPKLVSASASANQRRDKPTSDAKAGVSR